MLFYLFPQSWCWSWWKCRLSKWCQHHVVDAYSGPWGVAVVFLQQGCHSNFSLVCEYILSSMKKPERMLKVSIVFLEYWLCKPAGCNFFGHAKILFFVQVQSRIVDSLSSVNCTLPKLQNVVMYFETFYWDIFTVFWPRGLNERLPILGYPS